MGTTVARLGVILEADISDAVAGIEAVEDMLAGLGGEGERWMAGMAAGIGGGDLTAVMGGESVGLGWRAVQEAIEGARESLGRFGERLDELDVGRIAAMAEGMDVFGGKAARAVDWTLALARAVEGLDGMSAEVGIHMNYSGADIIRQIELAYGVDVNGNGIIGQAEGGDWMVRRPTLFLAGEAGPERAIFIPQHKGDLAPVGGVEGGGEMNGKMWREMADLMISLRMVFERLPEQIADAMEVR